jgi:hypothetical protein
MTRPPDPQGGSYDIRSLFRLLLNFSQCWPASRALNPRAAVPAEEIMIRIRELRVTISA